MTMHSHVEATMDERRRKEWAAELMRLDEWGRMNREKLTNLLTAQFDLQRVEWLSEHGRAVANVGPDVCWRVWFQPAANEGWLLHVKGTVMDTRLGRAREVYGLTAKTLEEGAEAVVWLGQVTARLTGLLAGVDVDDVTP